MSWYDIITVDRAEIARSMTGAVTIDTVTDDGCARVANRVDPDGTVHGTELVRALDSCGIMAKMEADTPRRRRRRRNGSRFNLDAELMQLEKMLACGREVRQ